MLAIRVDYLEWPMSYAHRDAYSRRLHAAHDAALSDSLLGDADLGDAVPGDARPRDGRRRTEPTTAVPDRPATPTSTTGTAAATAASGGAPGAHGSAASDGGRAGSGGAPSDGSRSGSGGAASDGTRGLISASWRRSIQAGVDPEDGPAPLALDLSRLGDLRESHPLRPVLPLLTETLARTADESQHVVVITDREGRVLWRDGNPGVMRRADTIGLTDGHGWSEERMGTNGIGTALRVRRPVNVYSAEHLLRLLHIWSCSAAPILDPDSGELLGCVDVSGTALSLHPATAALVGAAARLAESELALRMYERDERLLRRYEALRGRPAVLLSATGRVIAGDPGGALGYRVQLPNGGERLLLRDGRVATMEPFCGGYLVRATTAATTTATTTPAPPPLRLGFLGEGVPTATVSDRRLPLSLRHAEILALLALHPRGLSAEQLSFHLYGDAGNPVTIRAEIHRLRAQLRGTIGAKPYRLTSSVEADFLELRHLLAANNPAALARTYNGPLLPRSESPEIRRERDELEVQVRACLLLHGSPDDLWTYAQTANGRDDLQILERLAESLPFTDHRAAAARARLYTC
ncbi:GAF domain-containing protein [Nonomuraea sp. 3-1Str]|uniref:helix-turn-helix domain-containing protein n=1 Tax=Nonomuraea sp. 3-1Str TaxID=2929801 RepID=UPI002856C554|nr:GAF domain-containing protein [Nonomuraea sp. 3-1Str]MDR8408124.1 GAF domain-containing protein [Nonomuraea sp. 3-1Str]